MQLLFPMHPRERHAGNPVSRLPQTLRRCYRPGLVRDGIYGPQTASAVRMVHAQPGSTGNATDGIYGPQTSRRMFYAWFLHSNNQFSFSANRHGYID